MSELRKQLFGRHQILGYVLIVETTLIIWLCPIWGGKTSRRQTEKSPDSIRWQSRKKLHGVPPHKKCQEVKYGLSSEWMTREDVNSQEFRWCHTHSVVTGEITYSRAGASDGMLDSVSVSMRICLYMHTLTPPPRLSVHPHTHTHTSTFWQFYVLVTAPHAHIYNFPSLKHPLTHTRPFSCSSCPCCCVFRSVLCRPEVPEVFFYTIPSDADPSTEQYAVAIIWKDEWEATQHTTAILWF